MGQGIDPSRFVCLIQHLIQSCTRQINYPYRLPDDLKHFFLVTNGFLLRWHLKIRGTRTAPVANLMRGTKSLVFEQAMSSPLVL